MFQVLVVLPFPLSNHSNLILENILFSTFPFLLVMQASSKITRVIIIIIWVVVARGWGIKHNMTLLSTTARSMYYSSYFVFIHGIIFHLTTSSQITIQKTSCTWANPRALYTTPIITLVYDMVVTNLTLLLPLQHRICSIVYFKKIYIYNYMITLVFAASLIYAQTFPSPTATIIMHLGGLVRWFSLSNMRNGFAVKTLLFGWHASTIRSLESATERIRTDSE